MRLIEFYDSGDWWR